MSTEFEEPACVRRFWRRWHLGAGAAGAVLGLGGIAVLMRDQPVLGMQPGLFVLALVLTLLVPASVLRRTQYRRLMSRARTHDFALCEHCGYALGGLDQEGTCPECGTSYDIERARTRWRVTYNKARWPRQYVGGIRDTHAHTSPREPRRHEQDGPPD